MGGKGHHHTSRQWKWYRGAQNQSQPRWQDGLGQRGMALLPQPERHGG